MEFVAADTARKMSIMSVFRKKIMTVVNKLSDGERQNQTFSLANSSDEMFCVRYTRQVK